MPDDKKLITQLRGFDAQHYTATERYARQIDRVYKTACDEFARLGADFDAPNEAEFSFDKFPKARKQAQGILTRLVSKIEAVITTGTKSEWLAACRKNDAFLNSILRTSKLTKDEVAQYQDRNLEALSTFQKRKVGGLGLSERVWQYAGELKDAMELGIDVAIGEGRSAQELSRDLRGYLQEPDRLYRRVRDKGGNLRLSKAAKLYHPGQGVYRSSARNAQRLARTEVNMAYRESEFLRWQQLDFVVGFRVCLSNNHTTKDSKGKTVPLIDICDELWGDYPKTFKFTGWHPQCRCYVVPIMSDYDEYNKDRANRLKAIVRKAEYKSLPSRRTVRDVPAKFRSYIASIQERAKGWKSMPYYIRDNFKGGKIEGGLNATIPTQTMNTVEPCTDFDAQIATLKRWAYSFGLDLSNIESLRTAGNRNVLEAEVEKQRALGEKRQDEWHNAWNELKEFANTEAAGYKDVIDFCEKALKGNDVTTANYYADCISHLKQALTDALAKLTKAKESKTEYSKNMPEVLKKGEAWLRGEDYTYSKEFFDLIDESKPIPVTIHSKTGNDSYYSPMENRVYLDKKRRSEESLYYRKALIYHEFGHGIDWQRGLRHSKEIQDLRNKQIARLKKQVVQVKEKRYFDGIKGEYVTKQTKTKVMYAKVLSERVKAIYYRLYKVDESVFKRRGITKADVIEALTAVADTLRTFVNSKDIGWGHSVGYFNGKGMREAEYIAHAFENTFIGNRAFQHFMPTEYAEMIALIQKLKKP